MKRPLPTAAALALFATVAMGANGLGAGFKRFRRDGVGAGVALSSGSVSPPTPLSLFAAGSVEATECACPTNITASSGQVITTARSTTATCEKADGTLATCAANKPRVQSLGGGNFALRWEPVSATNVALQSEQFDQGAFWDLSGSGASAPVVTANQSADPSGGNGMDRVVFPSTTGTNVSVIYELNGYTATAAAWSASVFIKGSASSTINLFLQKSNGTLGGYTACAVTTSTSRCKVEGITMLAGTSYLMLGTKGTTYGTPAISAQTVYIWGAQIEASPHVTAYTGVTGGTSVTRTAETHSTPNPLAPYNPGTYCIGATVLPAGVWGGGSLARGFLALGTVAAANSAQLSMSTAAAPTFLTYDGTSTTKTFAASAVTGDATSHRLVATASNGTLALFLDGSASGSVSGTGTGTITQPSTLFLGGGGAGGLLSAIKSSSALGGCD